jgi:sulfite reductase alpha subunit-like flavoprotein
MEISTVIKNEEKVTLPEINESQTITIESDQLLTIIKEEYELQSIQEFLEQYTWDDAKYIQEHYTDKLKIH